LTSSHLTTYLRLGDKHERVRTPVARHRKLPDFRGEIGADRLLLGVETHAFRDMILAAVAPEICTPVRTDNVRENSRVKHATIK
jgi:hypothetical protein